ncbi:MMPL family transporter [Streptomyces sp. NPDC057307]|uniref:MMPL family transporter n=1 Tax=Streptomyces sp. NPDC057307 TaxID=3346096 RepID=UPI00363BB917
MEAWARWCYRHKLVVLVLWVGALAGLGVAGGTAGGNYANMFGIPGTDSSRAYDRMAEVFPESAGDTVNVVWRVDSGAVGDSAVRDRLEPALDRIGSLPGVGDVAGPYGPGPGGAARISEDGRTAYAQVTFAQQADAVPKELVQDVVDTARDAERAGLQVELGGQAITRISEPPTGLAELVGILAAGVVLFLAFGSLFSMLLPITVAVFGVGTGLMSTLLLSHVVDVPEVASLLGSLIGLGVGIDYALFIVTRHRRALLGGRSPEDSAALALNTAGRAVLFAGGTVCIALAGMLVTRMSFLEGVVIATSLTVVLSVLAAITLLPALLGLLGERVLSRRQRRRLAADGPEPAEAKGPAARWSATVQRRPRAIAAVAVVVMAALAIPVLSLRLGATDQGNHPESQTTRQAYDLLAEGFGPGFNGPLQLVAETGELGDPGSPDVKAAVDALVERVAADDGVAMAAAMPVPSASPVPVTVIQVVPTTSPQDAGTDRLIDRLRDDVIPDSGMEVHVGGVTAVFKDFSSVTADRMPLFIATIIGLGFLLLLLAFRSVVVPLTAAVMNLVAAAASFGVLVAIFQWGWGAELLGFGKEGPITAFLPVIMLSMLFGLSMDYQVFLVSRMHEEWVHTKDNARAVRVGLAETSRVINSAALIMICVFGAFVLSGDTEGAVAGVGLAAAVALDAFVLRTALVPAAMHLLGRANWWLPGWLDSRLPHLAVEAPETAPPTTADEPSPADGPSGTGPSGTDLSGTTVIHGFVRTEEGVPVPDAVLTLVSPAGKQLDRVATLADGAYILSAPAGGSYLLAVTSGAYEPWTRHLAVGGDPLVHDLTLSPSEAASPSHPA